MPSPPNQTALTAMVISSLPFTVTQDVADQANTLQLWYRYMATAADVTVGVVPYADIAGAYLPKLSIFTGPASAPVAYLVTNSSQRSAFVPVTAGTVYLWKVTQGGGTTPLGSSLTFKATASPQQTPPVGALLTTEENPGFPASIVSGVVSQTVYRHHAAFPLSIMGVTLKDGTIIADDDLNVAIFNPDLTQIYSGQPYYAFTPQWMSSNTIDTFYLPYKPGFGMPLVLRTLTAAGGMTAKTWTLPANSSTCVGGAPARDDTIFYYGGDAVTGTPQGVHRYDLVNSTGLSDLVGTLANHSILEILVAADGSILVKSRNGTTDFVVKRYDPAGSTLNTYTFTSIEVHHMALAYDDPLTFWVWLSMPLGAPTHSTFRRILLSDGSTVTEADYDLFVGGPDARSYDPTYAVIADVPLFGPAPTCTFFPLVGSPTPLPPIPPGPTGTVDPIRRLRQAPHLWDGASGHRLTYPGFQLLVESGALRDTDQPLTFSLQWSDDGGHTWSNLHDLTGSSQGQYTYRFWWRRLGQSRDRVFRVINSDDAKIVLIDALLVPDPIEGTS